VRIAFAALASLAACAGAPPPALSPGSVALPLANPGFEQAGPGGECPPGWLCATHAGARSHAYRLDPQAAGGRFAFCTDGLDDRNWAQVFQNVPAERLRGARVRLSVAVRIAKDRGEGAGPILVVQGGDGATVATDQKLLPDTGGWRRLATEVVVPPNAFQLQAGVLFESRGTACVDDALLEILPPA